MGFATLLWPQRQWRRARYGTSCTDHCTGAPFRCVFISASLSTHLQVWLCTVVGTAHDGADIMAFPWTSHLLLHGRSLQRPQWELTQLASMKCLIVSTWVISIIFSVYLYNDALLSRLSELFPGNEVDRAPSLLHYGLSAFHRIRQRARPTRWGALSFHLFRFPPHVAILI